MGEKAQQNHLCHNSSCGDCGRQPASYNSGPRTRLIAAPCTHAHLGCPSICQARSCVAHRPEGTHQPPSRCMLPSPQPVTHCCNTTGPACLHDPAVTYSPMRPPAAIDDTQCPTGVSRGADTLGHHSANQGHAISYRPFPLVTRSSTHTSPVAGRPWAAQAAASQPSAMAPRPNKSCRPSPNITAGLEWRIAQWWLLSPSACSRFIEPHCLLATDTCAVA